MLPRSRDAVSHPSFAHATARKPFQCLPQKRREAERRKAHHGFRPAAEEESLPAYAASAIASSRESRGTRSGGALAFRRPTAVMRRGTDLELGSGPRFLESPDPNGRTLSGTSAASTWQSGHAPDGRCPKPPGGTVYGRASGNRSRPIDRLSPVDVPSMGGPALRNDNGDGCQGLVAVSATKDPQAVMAGQGSPRQDVDAAA